MQSRLWLPRPFASRGTGTSAEPPGARVLVVCIGNICRIPMAEGLLRHALAERAPDALVESAGIAALAGYPADPTAVELMQTRGIDISAHRARQVRKALVKQFPLMLVMDEEQQRWLERRWRAARGRVRRLGQWDDTDIPDPFRGERREFERALDLIERAVTAWVEHLWPVVG